jgi:hypothetical protein
MRSVIDAQIYGGYFVAAAPDSALPLHDLGEAVPQTVPSGEKRTSVQPGRV